MPTGLTRNDVKEIKFDNTQLGFHGRAWCHSRRTTIGVPKHTRYRTGINTGGFRGYLDQTVYTWEEHLIELVSHELRHLWQHKKNYKLPREIKKIRKHNMGTRCDLAEVDASLYAKRTVRMYRRTNALT